MPNLNETNLNRGCRFTFPDRFHSYLFFVVGVCVARGGRDGARALGVLPAREETQVTA